MARIEWRDQMTIDGAVIDQDHRHLIDIVNRFTEMAERFESLGQALEILYALKFYTQTHFQREEDLQRLANYPFADAHAQEHADLIAGLERLIAEAQSDGGSHIHEVSTETAHLLHSWLVEHIVGSDLRMRPYVKKMRAHMDNLGALKDVELV